MKHYKNIIWDMDGTLLNTLDDLKDSVNEALQKFDLPLRTTDEIRSFIGNGVLNLITLSVPDGRQHPQFNEIFEYFEICYKNNCRKKTRPYDGLDTLLPALKKHGYRMAIVSNKVDFAVKELDELFFKGFMEAALGEVEELRRKPQPDLVYKAMEVIEAAPGSTVYIGDTEVDIATARNSGIDLICVSWGYRDSKFLKASGADIIVDSPEELLALLTQD